MKALITGASGFTAAHLVQRLRQKTDIDICGTDIGRSAPRGLDSYFPCDITEMNAVAELVKKTQPDWVFHLAGMFRGAMPAVYGVNLVGSVNLFHAVKCGAPRAAVLGVGSAAEYGIWPATEMPLKEDHECRPVGAYGLSKHAMTVAARDFARNEGLKVVVARPFNLVGAGLPTTLVVGALVQRMRAALAASETSIKIGNVEAQRDFIAIEDAVDGYVRLLESEAWGQVVNVCSGQPTPIRFILETLLSFADKPLEVVQDEALQRANDAPISIGDPSLARQLCGFTPRIKIYDALRSAWKATSPN